MKVILHHKIGYSQVIETNGTKIPRWIGQGIAEKRITAVLARDGQHLKVSEGSDSTGRFWYTLIVKK